MDVWQMAIVIALLVLIASPLGTYLHHVFSNKSNRTDRWFGWVERPIYMLAGLKSRAGMSWKRYAVSVAVTNVVLAAIGCLLLLVQSGLPLNPNAAGNMEPTLALNTAISFVTNTNLQHYSGETGLTYLSQMAVITMLMFTSAATGISVAAAFVRGITGKGETLGNFFEDLVKAHTRLLLPLATLLTLVLVALQVPQTLDPALSVTTLQGATQHIAIGPVASLESIKHLGTNGGGFFGANSAHPFENPSPLTNVIEIWAMGSLPAALPFMYGKFANNGKQGRVIFAAMLALFLVFLTVAYTAEKAGNPALNALGIDASQGSMEGKEVRFGIAQSALFTTVTAAATTGTVNNMHDTLTPLGGLVPLAEMMLNVVFGGKGVGLINMLMYAILAVFICGLMVGRTPEFLGRKIEPPEMRWIAAAILAHPIIILAPTALAFLTEAGKGAITNPGFHGITQVLYEYTSSAANNGSGFEGLADNTPFWNMSTALVMLLGRYVSMIAMLAVAGSLTRKMWVPETSGTFRTDNTLFAVMLLGTVFLIGALTFLPVIALGPIAEHLTIR